MAISDPEKAAHIARMRKEYEKRLRVLELRIARQGDNTPPETINEAEQIKVDIAGLNIAEAPQPNSDVMALMGRQDQLMGTVAAVTRLGVQVNELAKSTDVNKTEMKVWYDEVRGEMAEVRAEVISERAVREEWRDDVRVELGQMHEQFGRVAEMVQSEVGNRKGGQRLTRILLLAGLLLNGVQFMNNPVFTWHVWLFVGMLVFVVILIAIDFYRHRS
jgi:hypothetical protein